MLNLTPAVLISRIVTLLVAFSIHEFAHAWSAYKFGDDTAARAGRLTLNPIAHLDIIGTLMLIVGGFGWAKPVPVNSYALQRKSSSALMLVSLAGPVSNMLLAILAAVPFRLGLVSYSPSNSIFFPSISDFLITFIIINISLLLFNLIPLAPLDGEKVLYGLLPPSGADFMDRIRPYGPLLLLAFIMIGRVGGLDLLGALMGPPLTAIFRLLMGA